MLLAHIVNRPAGNVTRVFLGMRRRRQGSGGTEDRLLEGGMRQEFPSANVGFGDKFGRIYHRDSRMGSADVQSDEHSEPNLLGVD